VLPAAGFSSAEGAGAALGGRGAATPGRGGPAAILSLGETGSRPPAGVVPEGRVRAPLLSSEPSP